MSSSAVGATWDLLPSSLPPSIQQTIHCGFNWLESRDYEPRNNTCPNTVIQGINSPVDHRRSRSVVANKDFLHSINNNNINNNKNAPVWKLWGGWMIIIITTRLLQHNEKQSSAPLRMPYLSSIHDSLLPPTEFPYLGLNNQYRAIIHSSACHSPSSCVYHVKGVQVLLPSSYLWSR